MDILIAGCNGTLKMNKEKFGSNRGPDGKETIEIDSDIEIKKDPTFRSLLVRKVQKSLVEDSHAHSAYMDRIDLHPFNNFHPSSREPYPNIIIGRMYEDKKERKGGTLEKGVYDIKYNVMKNADGRLEVTVEGNVAQQWNHMPIGEKYNYKMFCLGKSVEELNSMAEAAKQAPEIRDIGKKVFGN